MTNKIHDIKFSDDVVKNARRIVELNELLDQGSKGLAEMQNEGVKLALDQINSNNIADARKTLTETLRGFKGAVMVITLIERELHALSHQCQEELRETVEDNKLAHGAAAEDAATALKKVMGK